MSEEPRNALQVILEEVNLPKIIGGRAGAAIAELIGLPFEYLKALAERPLQSIKDKTAAQSRIRKALAEALEHDLAEDPEAVDRYAHSLGKDFCRKQDNREAVAAIALQQLSSDGSQSNTSSEEPVDEDWMNAFSEFAGRASSDRMRDLWGRVLAGEIRKSGTFSLSCLRFMSEIDQPKAELIEKFRDRVVNSEYLLKLDDKSDFIDTMRLEEWGLITSSSIGVAGLSDKVRLGPEGLGLRTFNGDGVVFEGRPNAEINIPILYLTTLGAEVYGLIGSKDKLMGEAIVRAIKNKSQLTGVWRGDFEQLLNNQVRYTKQQLLWQDQEADD